MLAIKDQAEAGKRWFATLSERTRQVVTTSVAILILGTLLTAGLELHHRSQPSYVLEMFDHVNSKADLQREAEYFTPQGQEILLWLMDKAGDKPPGNTKAVYSDPLMSGDECNIPVRQGQVSGVIRLVRTDHWRFHDIYYAKIGDEKVELWASYMKDHPMKAWWHIHGDELFGAFIKGAVTGASMAR